jgi:hypothetical protein
MKLEFLNVLLESENTRIPHPEDSIFQGSSSAKQYVAALKEAIQQPEKITIKWDGGIALMFGFTPGGEFFCSDKYMYAASYFAKRPEDWEHYDQNIKSSKSTRPDLYPKIAAIWNGLRADVGNTQSVFKGDLMAVNPTGEPLQPTAQGYVFQPTTVTYTIPVNSPIGKLINGKVAAIVVHQMDNKPWDGETGLTNSGNVAIISPKAGNTFSLKEPTQVLANAAKAVNVLGEAADAFLAGLDSTAKGKLQTYFNKQITGQTKETLHDWLANPETKISRKQLVKLLGDGTTPGYLSTNKAGLDALATIWNNIYALKTNISAQLEPQVKGFTQQVAGTNQGEGFVFPSSIGLIKFVNRGVFGLAHFNK